VNYRSVPKSKVKEIKKRDLKQVPQVEVFNVEEIKAPSPPEQLKPREISEKELEFVFSDDTHSR
jgi:hypothetical protein